VSWATGALVAAARAMASQVLRLRPIGCITRTPVVGEDAGWCGRAQAVVNAAARDALRFTLGWTSGCGSHAGPLLPGSGSTLLLLPPRAGGSRSPRCANIGLANGRRSKKARLTPGCLGSAERAAQRTLPRRNRFTIASRMIAPISDTTK